MLLFYYPVSKSSPIYPELFIVENLSFHTCIFTVHCGKENVIHNPLCESGFILIEITISITCMNIDGLWIFQCLFIHKCFIDFHGCVNLKSQYMNEKHKGPVFLFATNFDATDNNNLADSSFRMVSGKRNDAGSFRSEKGAQVLVNLRLFTISVSPMKNFSRTVPQR